MKENLRKKLDLTKLLDGMPQLDASWVEIFAKCCTVCLEYHNHSRGIELVVNVKIDKELVDYFAITNWIPLEDKIKRTFNNLNDAVEYAACGIAGLLIWEFTEYEVIEQAQIGNGVDYWLRKKEFDVNNPFIHSARLEVSGILSGDISVIKNRLKRKLEQTKLSDTSSIPAFVVIVEFSRPEVSVVKK
jgi:hypothetical protein